LNLTGGTMTGNITTKQISESISTTYTFSSNVLTYNYSNGSIIYFNGLTSDTNFELDITNINSSNLTNTSFTVSVIIDTSSYKAHINTLKVNTVSETLNVSGGLANINVDDVTTSGAILQTITIIYTNSGTSPTKVISNIGSYY
jgi:hypothetical protein